MIADNHKEKDFRSRLSESDKGRELLPWQKAHQYTRCSLYWVGVKSTPFPLTQRRWLLTFLDRLASGLAADANLRAEIFLQLKTIHPHLADDFMREAFELIPVLGLTRRPGSQLPPPPTDQTVKDLQEGRKQYDINDYLGDYAYRFLGKAGPRIRELFLGYGGMSMIFLKPDPNTVPPPLEFPRIVGEWPQMKSVLAMFNPQQCQAAAYSFLDGFLAKSKQLFGSDMEKDPQFRGLSFILPLLSSRDFFAQPPDSVARWFELFDVYVNESPQENGVILAAKNDLDERMVEIVKGMRDEGLHYPES